MLEGLLGMLGEMTPEKRNALLQAAGAMMASKGNAAQGIGNGLLTGATAFNQNKMQAAKLAEEADQKQMRGLLMQQQQQNMADRTGMRSAFQTAFAPPQQLDPRQQEGGQESIPGGGGVPDFLRRAAPYMDPMQAMSMMQKQQPKFHVVGGALVPEPQDGQTTSTPAYTAPEKQEGPKLGQMRELKAGRRVITQEYDGRGWKTISTGDLDKPDGPDKPDKPPQGYRFKQDGSLEFIKGGPADPTGGKPTDTERVAAGYASRMVNAEKLMAPVAQSAKPGVFESMAGKLPGVGEVTANLVRSDDRQSYRQAQEDWVRAKLRKESGAVIADAEMEREIRTYFPQINDGPKVVAQKAQARQVAIEAMKTGAGPVMQPDVNDLIRKYLGR